MHTIEQAVRVAKAAAGVTIIIIANDKASGLKYPESTYTTHREPVIDGVKMQRVAKITTRGTPRRVSQRNGPYDMPRADKPGVKEAGLRFSRWLTSKMNKHGLSDHMLEKKMGLPYSSGHSMRSGKHLPRRNRVSEVKAFFRNLNGAVPKATAKGRGAPLVQRKQYVRRFGGLPQWLTDKMNEKKITDRGLGEKLGVTGACVYQWRTGRSKISDARKRQLFDFFGEEYIDPATKVTA